VCDEYKTDDDDDDDMVPSFKQITIKQLLLTRRCLMPIMVKSLSGTDFSQYILASQTKHHRNMTVENSMAIFNDNYRILGEYKHLRGYARSRTSGDYPVSS